MLLKLWDLSVMRKKTFGKNEEKLVTRCVLLPQKPCLIPSVLKTCNCVDVGLKNHDYDLKT